MSRQRRADAVELVELLGGRLGEETRASPVPGAPGAPGALVPPAPAAGALPRTGTTTCWPSRTGAARLTAVMSARGVGPRARLTAADTRASAGRR
ncbi:MAG: hypothetical protein WKF31_01505 [Thermoleophilaceae bacterium]